MNAAQAKTIGKLLPRIHSFTEREGLRYTTSGITIEESGAGRGQVDVTLYACRADNDDFNVRVGISREGELLPLGLQNAWDPRSGSMTGWTALDTLTLR